MSPLCPLRTVFCFGLAAIMLGCDENPDPGKLTPPRPSPLVKVSPDADRPKVAVVESVRKPPIASEPPLLVLTPKAVKKINQIVKENKWPHKAYLRVTVFPGGCQGYYHKVDLDPNVSSEDAIEVCQGISTVALKNQIKMLRGTRFDFVDEDGKQGFKLDNPHFKGKSAKKWIEALMKEKAEKEKASAERSQGERE